jgi:hypothetical protein
LAIIWPLKLVGANRQPPVDRGGDTDGTGTATQNPRCSSVPVVQNVGSVGTEPLYRVVLHFANAEWFKSQEMDRYNINQSLTGASSVDDLANAVALREDIHTALVKGTFIFTRKQDAWVSHFLTPTRNLGPEHHNVIVDMHPVVSEAFILANIARAVFLRLPNFLTRGEKRLVKVKVGCNFEVLELDGKELQKLLDSSDRARSRSPRKRQREVDLPSENIGQTNFKRACLQMNNHEEIPETPSFTYISSVEDSETSNLRWQEGKDCQIEQLRQRGLRKQREMHRGLSCCDYDAAEIAVRDGLTGPRAFGGAHLCWACLGADMQNPRTI